MPIARAAPAATSRSRAPAHFPVPWPGYWPDRPADATGTAGRAPYAGCEERPYTLASAPSRVATLTRAAPLAEGIAMSDRASPQSSPRIEQLALELEKIISPSEPIQHLAEGFGGPQGPAEGPLWWKEGGYPV